MKIKSVILLLASLTFLSCQEAEEHKTVICIPVYGQSLSLGVDAIRVTDFDSLANYAHGRIVTENLDHHFGYFDLDHKKQLAKKLLRYHKRSFELTSYRMAETVADNLGEDTLVCIFPGGQDGTIISELGKGSEPYQKFVDDIETAYKAAKKRGWAFVMPALCWMQGETDVTTYPGTNYRELLLKFTNDINDDVKRITGQKQDIEFVCYQTGPVTRAPHFNPLSYDCPETEVPQTQLELVRDHPAFHASGPMYPYDFVDEIIHIDGISHQRHGQLVAMAMLDILRHQKKPRGLLPLSAKSQGQEVVIDFQVPYPPLVLDTIRVAKADHYGFSVITPDHRDIAQTVSLHDNSVHIQCSESTENCRVRYAINGEKTKSGRLHGPRGNLRDSQGDTITLLIMGNTYPIDNWCWQFDMPL